MSCAYHHTNKHKEDGVAELRARVTERPHPPRNWNLPSITLTAGMNLGWAESEIMAYVYLCLRTECAECTGLFNHTHT